MMFMLTLFVSVVYHAQYSLATEMVTSTLTSTTTAGCLPNIFDKCASIVQSDCCNIDWNTWGYTYSYWCPTTCCESRCVLPDDRKVITIGFANGFDDWNKLYCVTDLLPTCDEVVDCCAIIPFWETNYYSMCPHTCCNAECTTTTAISTVECPSPFTTPIITKTHPSNVLNVDPCTSVLEVDGDCANCMVNVNLTQIGVIEFTHYVGNIDYTTFPKSVHTLIFNTLVGNVFAAKLNNITTFIVRTHLTGSIHNYSATNSPTQFYIACSSTHLGPEIHVGNCTCPINGCNLDDISNQTVLLLVVYITIFVLFIMVLIVRSSSLQL